MKTFEFKVVEYLKFSDGQICLGGYMTPNDADTVTPDYKVTLFTKSGREHSFFLVGEEIFARSEPRKDDKRVLRTSDDIEQYLIDLTNDPVTIIGCK